MRVGPRRARRPRGGPTRGSLCDASFFAPCFFMRLSFFFVAFAPARGALCGLLGATASPSIAPFVSVTECGVGGVGDKLVMLGRVRQRLSCLLRIPSAFDASRVEALQIMTLFANSLRAFRVSAGHMEPSVPAGALVLARLLRPCGADMLSVGDVVVCEPHADDGTAASDELGHFVRRGMSPSSAGRRAPLLAHPDRSSQSVRCQGTCWCPMIPMVTIIASQTSTAGSCRTPRPVMTGAVEGVPTVRRRCGLSSPARDGVPSRTWGPVPTAQVVGRVLVAAPEAGGRLLAVKNSADAAMLDSHLLPKATELLLSMAQRPASGRR